MPSTSHRCFRKHSTAPSSAWSIVVDGSRCKLTRAWSAMLAPYLVLLAITIAYYPFTAWLLSHRTVSASGFMLAIVSSLPIIAMVSWVPRLATERRRIQLSIDPVQLTVERTRLDRARLLEVVLLPHRTLTGVQHRVFITYASGDFANMIALATERRVEDARGIARALALWLSLPLSAATSAPPTATLVRR
jgi:hypothetical protein